MTPWDGVPDLIEPITGFRMWLYTSFEDEARLYPVGRMGLSTPSPWDGAEAGWVTAECAAEGTDPNHAPAEECGCGFYAVKRLEFLTSFASHPLMADGVGFGLILGRVALAGKVIEHDFGYRAERARIVELIPIEGDEAGGERLSRVLGLPLGTPVPAHAPPRSPEPPRGPSTLRLRVRHWVQDVAA